MNLREILWIVLFFGAVGAVVKAKFLSPPCPVLTDLHPAVKNYIDLEIPAGKVPTEEEYDKAREQLRALEAKLAQVQKIAADIAKLETKQKQAESTLKEIREIALKTMEERRLTEVQWMKSNVSMKCAGFSLKSSSGQEVSLPPLPTDILNPETVKPVMPLSNVAAAVAPVVPTMPPPSMAPATSTATPAQAPAGAPVSPKRPPTPRPMVNPADIPKPKTLDL